MNVIEVEGLRKTYRRWRKAPALAVDGLSFAVPQGGVFGFLGPNGSGKTTTIRCILGLISPSDGRTRLLGAERASLHTVVPRVGALVESPAFFPNFSGKRNLDLFARMVGLPRARVDETLERVGLGARGDDNFKTYSLGMKQRLGIGAALLKDPEVLILDEPANGLDPAGIKEVRELLRSLGDEGRTVFLSSHLLGEVQQVCDRVAILSRGRCIAAGDVNEVLTGGRARGVVLRIDDVDAALDALRAKKFDAERNGDGTIRVAVPPEDASLVTKALAGKRLYLSELHPEEISLEDVFLELTGTAAGITLTACPHCGAETRAGAHFCTSCGQTISGVGA